MYRELMLNLRQQRGLLYAAMKQLHDVFVITQRAR